jgi:hypothetical protein
MIITACEDDQPPKKDIGANLASTNILAETLAVYKEKNGSMDDVKSLLKSKYAIEFDQHYKNILPSLTATKPQKMFRTLEMTLGDLEIIMATSGITTDSETYQYLQALSNLFEGGQLSEDEILTEMSNLKNGVENNSSLNPQEKDRLIFVSTLMFNNFLGITDVLATADQTSGGRAKGWLQKAWRVVRSVVLIAGVGAAIGSTEGPYGAVVGAIVMGVVAIADAAFNDNCHFAMQCPGGWRQDCTTGVCKPF